MNWLEFIAIVIGSLAWPIVFVVIFHFLREPVKNVLPLLQRLKYKEFELEFSRRVEEVSADVVRELPALPPVCRYRRMNSQPSLSWQKLHRGRRCLRRGCP